MNILLIYPPYISKVKTLPLGIAYLKAFLKGKGHRVNCIDMSAMHLDYQGLEEAVRKSKPDVAGVSFMTVQADNAQEVARTIKKVSKDIVTVAGGVHASALPVETLGYGNFDFAVLGEGEESFSELIQLLENGKNDFSRIKGIAFKDGSTVLVNESRGLIENIDLLPFPDWSDFPISNYTNAILGSDDDVSVFPILSTRGCPYDCIFCASNVIFKRKYRARSSRNIFQEVLGLMDRYNVCNFDFVDDTLTLDSARLIELCNLIIAKGIKIKWICNARVNNFTEAIARKLKDAGCVNICFGVESGDPAVWKAIKKNISYAEVISAHEAAKKAGLVVTSFFMVGNLEESRGSIRKTLELVSRLKTDYPTCSIATPYPGTRMYEIAKKENWLTVRGWGDYTTSPHVKSDYRPVWSNGILSGKEMLDAYYYINHKFLQKKLSTRYGVYYLNPRFYKNEIYSRIRNIGFKGIFKMALQLMRARK